MAPSPQTPGVVAGRLSPEALRENFADIAPAFTPHEALVAADRCYFCYDAPCTAACPTAIDVPLFIRQIQAGQPEAAARTIFAQNILGGMCARVCPTETLCEEACVREAAEGRPVEIGRLQRHATDALMATGRQPFARAAATGKRVAVVGAGPAGLACAHRLAMLGHDVVLFDARAKLGGLNEFGIAAYKTVGGFAQAEVEWLLGIGGIELRPGQRLGAEITLDALRRDHDAVFLGVGLVGVRALGLAAAGAVVRPAVEFIAEVRQDELAQVPVGRRVVVIGGGMTAIDAGVQAKKLGAEEVTIAYRRDRAAMSASGYEQELAATHGVRILTEATPVAVRPNGAGGVVEFARPDGERLAIAADEVLTAIGQTLGPVPEGLRLDGGKIAVDGPGRTSLPGVWAGGDCAAGGNDLTVTAVAEGRDAALDIHAVLSDVRRAPL